MSLFVFVSYYHKLGNTLCLSPLWFTVDLTGDRLFVPGNFYVAELLLQQRRFILISSFLDYSHKKDKIIPLIQTYLRDLPAWNELCEVFLLLKTVFLKLNLNFWRSVHYGESFSSTANETLLKLFSIVDSFFRITHEFRNTFLK